MGGTAGMSRFFCVQFGVVLLLLATVLPSRLTNISSWELLCLHGEGADDLQRRARAHGEAGRPAAERARATSLANARAKPYFRDSCSTMSKPWPAGRSLTQRGRP